MTALESADGIEKAVEVTLGDDCNIRHTLNNDTIFVITFCSTHPL